MGNLSSRFVTTDDKLNVRRQMRVHMWNSSRRPPCYSYGPCVWAVPRTLKGGRSRTINKRRWYRYPRWSWPSVSIQRSTFSMDLTQADDGRGACFVFQIAVFYPLYNILFRPEGVNHPPVHPNQYSSETTQRCSPSATHSVPPRSTRLRSPLPTDPLYPMFSFGVSGKSDIRCAGECRKAQHRYVGHRLSVCLRSCRGRESWVSVCRSGGGSLRMQIATLRR